MRRCLALNGLSTFSYILLRFVLGWPMMLMFGVDNFSVISIHRLLDMLVVSTVHSVHSGLLVSDFRCWTSTKMMVGKTVMNLSCLLCI